MLCHYPDTYYIAFPNDRIQLKLIVYATLLLETIQTVTLTRDAFDTFVTHLGDGDAIDKVRLTWLAIPVSGGLGKFHTALAGRKLNLLSFPIHPPQSRSLAICFSRIA